MEEINNPQENTTNNTENVATEPAKPTCTCTTEPTKPKRNVGTIICMIILFIGLGVLYILHFTSGSNTTLSNPEATPVMAGDGAKIAYINTDTLMAKYQYAIDLNNELMAYQSSKESSYQNQMRSFEADYNNYLKVGGDMTLSQQKAKEEELQQRANRMQSLEGEYAMQIQNKTLTESEKMTKAVYAFIREYNKANQQFDLIFARSFSGSPILYGNPGMDITNEIVEGLNKEYAAVKAKEAKDKK